jgi:putative transposase
MSDVYKVYDQSGVYYITNTVHQWIDVFTRREYAQILLDSLHYCQQHKGLCIYEWVMMSNHVHLIISSTKDNLSDIIRDFKKYTATQIYNAIADNAQESRKGWLMWLLRQEGEILFWQDGYHGEEVRTKAFYDAKSRYIHLNPLRAGIVNKEEEYRYSSCGDRYGTNKGLLELSEFI